MPLGRHPQTQANQAKPGRLFWIEWIKAVALVGIFLNHLVERILGYPYIANPSANWPPLAERLAQLHPLKGFGVWDIPLNLLRYVGWGGEHGVQLFLIVSGFGLTWGLLSSSGEGSLGLKNYCRRRFVRIYPLWWGVHLLFITFWILSGFGLSLKSPSTYLSLIGIRITPSLLYYFAPAWWFFGCLLQLYLIYPVLLKILKVKGPLGLLIIGFIFGFGSRALGVWVPEKYLDAWLRGAVFITRLPEFVFGISLAAWVYRSPAKSDRWLRRRGILLLSVLSIAAGTLLALTLPGMTVAPFLIGVGAFVLLYALFVDSHSCSWRRLDPGKWVGRHSYSLYLLHHPLILALVPAGRVAISLEGLLGTFAVIVFTIFGAMFLEWAVGRASTLSGRWYRRVGFIGLGFRIMVFIIALAAFLLGSELIVQRISPQEVLGWGERPSLQPDPSFGWRLKASRQTRLRWESYDYTVTANALGFPGPDYPLQKGQETLRIMTTGDAFTSAEGVDTAQAWPRLLEKDLGAHLSPRRVEVLNFAITAYGPNQYAAIVKEFAPIYQPDLIIIGFFVNEYKDVLLDSEGYQKQIGFARPAPDSWRSTFQLRHLRRWIELELKERIRELLKREPRSHGYFLGNFALLKKGQESIEVTGRRLVEDRMREIKVVADQVGARVIIVMIPAPVQVCKPEHLDYYPRYIDLNDPTKYDLELPQRMTKEIAATLGFGYQDLRDLFRSWNEDCPYQRRNMHWTEAAHRAVAAHVAGRLVSEKYIDSRGP